MPPTRGSHPTRRGGRPYKLKRNFEARPSVAAAAPHTRTGSRLAIHLALSVDYSHGVTLYTEKEKKSLIMASRQQPVSVEYTASAAANTLPRRVSAPA